MKFGKLWLTMILGAMPATAMADPMISADVSVDLSASYDTSAPGVPIESVDVFYDQLAPYGMWVDEPTIGREFIPQEDNFVPYTNGHWENTTVGFVWVASEPFAMQTSHYGRWAYVGNYWGWVPGPVAERPVYAPALVAWVGGGGFGGGAPATTRRYNLTFSVNARNVLNKVNAAPPIGVLSSPNFGQSIALAGEAFSSAAANRKIELQAMFSF